MAKMSKTQSDYAVQRLRSAHEKRVQAVKAAHMTPGKTLTPTEKWDLILANKVPVHQKYESKASLYYVELRNMFDLSSFESEDVMAPEGVALLTEIEAQYRAAMDELMLGDAEGALEAIRAFEGGV